MHIIVQKYYSRFHLSDFKIIFLLRTVCPKILTIDNGWHGEVVTIFQSSRIFFSYIINLQPIFIFLIIIINVSYFSTNFAM